MEADRMLSILNLFTDCGTHWENVVPAVEKIVSLSKEREREIREEVEGERVGE